MKKVSKQEFEDAVYGLEVSSTEKYANGIKIEHYSQGKGEYHKLIGFVKSIRGIPTEYYLTEGE